MELSLAASSGKLTRAEQKILDYINTNTDSFLFSSIGSLPSVWNSLTRPSPDLPGMWAAPTSKN